jgi:DNA-binding LacI/PurR family transcriptional regulator
MCGNDLVALGVIKAARERGLDVPGDLAVAGFDDFDFAAAVDPPLTTVRIPGYEMGRYAAATLLDAVASGDRPQGRIFDTDVLLRGSA